MKAAKTDTLKFEVPSEASAYAKKKARYGHRDWIIYRAKDGGVIASRRSAESLKAALLNVGVKGRFTCYSASDCVPQAIGWSIGIIMLSNTKHGWN